MDTIEKFIAETKLAEAFSRFKNKNTYFNELSLEEEFLIWHYTGGASDDLNNALRTGNVSEYFRYYEHYLNNALDKLPCYLGMSYRGRRNVSDEELSEYEIAFEDGTEIVMLCFYSTTYIQGIARNFTKEGKKALKKIIFNVDGKSGRKIEPLSQFPQEEKEILFKSKCRFLISNITEYKKIIYIDLQEL